MRYDKGPAYRGFGLPVDASFRASCATGKTFRPEKAQGTERELLRVKAIGWAADQQPAILLNRVPAWRQIVARADRHWVQTAGHLNGD